MTNKYGLMKILEIQNSYQKHKKRLLSIQTFDAKRKVQFSTTKNIQAINSYKRHKITSQVFNQKKKQSQIVAENSFIHQNLVKVLKRKPNITMKHHDSLSSMRSISSSGNSRVIKEQNNKLKDKLANTKSTYQKFRDTYSTQKKKSSLNSKTQIIKLLQNQLGRKPVVVFPEVRKTKIVQDHALRLIIGKIDLDFADQQYLSSFYPSLMIINYVYFAQMIRILKVFHTFSKEVKSNKKADFSEKMKIFREMVPYIVPFIHPNKKVTKSLMASYFHLFLGKLCFFGGPLLLKSGINTIHSVSFFDPLLMFFGYGLCYSASVLFQSLRNQETLKVTTVALLQTTQRAYRHLLNLDPDFFFSGPQRHRIFNLAKAQSAIEQNLKAFTQYFLPIFVDIIMSTFLLLYYSGSWFVVSFVTCYSAYSIFTIRYSEYRRQGIKQQRDCERQLDLITSETFSNYYNVKYFSNEKYELEKYQKAMVKFYEKSYQNQKSLSVLNTTQRFIFGAGLTFNMILAAYYAQLGILTTGDIIFIQTLMLQFLNPLFFLGTMYRSFTDNFIDIRQLDKILGTSSKTTEGTLQIQQFKGNIKFNNVKFFYGEQANPVFTNINLQIKENQFIALVGQSGSGKTTLLHLIFRLYDVSEGSIEIDGINIKDLKFNFRKNISFVSQSPYLFNGTVMQNLKYSNADATDDDIYELTKELDLHDYIMELPQQYNTKVGEKGSIFSGGQKQRISLIRALLKKTKIILLDQPTSSLDSITEAKVGNLLLKYDKCTRIMITHRQSMAFYANRTISIHNSDTAQR